MRTIGFITRNFSGSWQNIVLRGVASATRALGVRLINIDASIAEIGIHRYANTHIDGWLTLGFTDGIERLAETGKPIVMLCLSDSRFSSIRIDNAGTTEAIVNHLISLGHRRIAFGGFMANEDVRERLAGYKTALAKHAITFDPAWVIENGDLDYTGGAATVRSLLSSGLDITALVAANDSNAFGCIEALQQAGYRVPEDIAITGFDDTDIAQSCNPPLTTARVRFELIGRAGVKQLLDEIEHPRSTPTTMYVQPTLIIRQSCGSPHALISEGTQEPQATPTTPHALMHKLTEMLISPEALPVESDIAAVWPAGKAIGDTLVAAIHNNPLPTASQIQAAWSEALGIAPFNDIQTMLLDTLSTVVHTWPEISHDPASQQRVRAVWSWMHSQHRAVSIGRELERRTQRERLWQTMDELNYHTTISDPRVPALGWLRRTQVEMACYGAWVHPNERSQLQITSSYNGNGHDIGILHTNLSPEEFPPQAFVDSAFAGGAVAVLMTPIRSSTTEWGMIALSQAYNVRFGPDDIVAFWADPIAAKLDEALLKARLEQQHRDLQRTYERERALADTVRELGCPIIPLSKGKLLIPLIGLIDSTRAQMIIEATLEAVSKQRANHVLLDVSGVPLIDTHVAGVLLQLTQMLQLLGAEAGIVGVRPEIAQSIVGLGVDLRQIRSYATLEMALR